MAKNHSEDEKRAAINEAKRAGESPSAAGATTGASKQISTKPHAKREPKGDRKT